MIDINRIKVTGDREFWIALPDGYQPTGTYKRTAIGGKKTLDMLRDIANEAKRFPSDGETYIVFNYSTVLLDDPKYGRDIRRQIDDIDRGNGVYVCTTQDARPTR